MTVSRWFFPVSVAALLLAYCVVVMGAFVRLSDAGLGCPDWPGCYGQMVVPEQQQAIARVDAAHPNRPLQPAKAWKEMIHRYAAGTLGLLILALALMALARRRAAGQPVTVPVVLLGLVIFQALLGMWTVTWQLKPIVVTAHLLGGMTILGLLFWLVHGQRLRGSPTGVAGKLLPWAGVALAVLAVQIFLGGWTSANYAALICPDFPTCRGGAWWPPTNFSEAFTFTRSIGIDYQGGVMDAAGRTAVQLSHRIGALVTALVLGVVALRALLSGDRRARLNGIVILLLLCAQISLGIGNVLLRLPLPVAVAHNGTAALLLLSVVALLQYAAFSRKQEIPP